MSDNDEKTTGTQAQRKGQKQSGARGQQAKQGNGKGNGNGKGQQNRGRRPRRHHNQQQEVAPQANREDLAKLKVAELKEKAAELELEVKPGTKKDQLVDLVLEALIKAEGFVECEGVLDLFSEGYGFLRAKGYLPSENDVYVGVSMIRRNGLRKGDWIRGQVRPAKDNEKYAALHRIDTVNDMTLEEIAHRPKFADLTPIFPDERDRKSVV